MRSNFVLIATRCYDSIEGLVDLSNEWHMSPFNITDLVQFYSILMNKIDSLMLLKAN